MTSAEQVKQKFFSGVRLEDYEKLWLPQKVAEEEPMFHVVATEEEALALRTKPEGNKTRTSPDFDVIDGDGT